MQTITLKYALQVWQANYPVVRGLRNHLKDGVLAHFAELPETKRREGISHIARCPACAERFRKHADIAEQSRWMVIYRKAAAGEARQYPIIYHSERGEYKIEILQNADGGDTGLVILSILDNRLASQCEGREFTVCDADGHNLLRGKITHGRVLQKTDRLSEINDRNFLIRPSTIDGRHENHTQG